MEPRISSLLADSAFQEKSYLYGSGQHEANYGAGVSFAKPSPVEPSLVKSTLPTARQLPPTGPTAPGGLDPNSHRSIVTETAIVGVNADEQTSHSEHRRSIKSAVPLAGVLNAANDQTEVLYNGSVHTPPRQRRGVAESPVTEHFTLPRPNPSVKASLKRPRIPPLLQGLHQPPPNAALFPPITADAFTGGIRKYGSEEQRKDHAEGSLIENDVKGRGECPNTDRRPGHIRRNKWSEQETSDLLHGVARFGIGSWKKILSHPDYSFNARTAVDLKDRCVLF